MRGAQKNCTQDQIFALLKSSKHGTLRCIHDEASGDIYYWPAEDATHREMADHLNLSYDKRPGEGLIVVDDG